MAKRAKKEKKRKIDTRPQDSAEWRLYLMDPGSVPGYREDCPCKKEKCERHGSCQECYAYHAAGKLLPCCLRG
jgi:hypothetical protein